MSSSGGQPWLAIQQYRWTVCAVDKHGRRRVCVVVYEFFFFFSCTRMSISLRGKGPDSLQQCILSSILSPSPSFFICQIRSTEVRFIACAHVPISLVCTATLIQYVILFFFSFVVVANIDIILSDQIHTKYI